MVVIYGVIACRYPFIGSQLSSRVTPPRRGVPAVLDCLLVTPPRRGACIYAYHPHGRRDLRPSIRYTAGSRRMLHEFSIFPENSLTPIPNRGINVNTLIGRIIKFGYK